MTSLIEFDFNFKITRWIMHSKKTTRGGGNLTFRSGLDFKVRFGIFEIDSGCEMILV